MIGSGGQQVDISKYLVNFNAADWANQANSYLTSALNQGIAASNNYNQQAINSQLTAQNQANQAATQGYNMAQALNAPQRLAAYGALDAYQDSLGLARPAVGSFQLSQALQNQAQGLPNIPAQTQVANAFNQGLLG
jgi:hypothetical protein